MRLYEKASEKGHEQAAIEYNRLKALEEEVKNKRKEEERKRKEEQEAIEAAMPKCPWCGKPLKKLFVDKMWGYRFFHAHGNEGCKWTDGKLREPYTPEGYIRVYYDGKNHE